MDAAASTERQLNEDTMHSDTRTTALLDYMSGFSMWATMIAEGYYLAHIQLGMGWMGVIVVLMAVPLFMFFYGRWLIHTSTEEWPGEMFAEDDEHLIRHASEFSIGMHEWKIEGTVRPVRGWSIVHFKKGRKADTRKFDFAISVSRDQLEGFCRDATDLIKKNPTII